MLLLVFFDLGLLIMSFFSHVVDNEWFGKQHKRETSQRHEEQEQHQRMLLVACAPQWQLLEGHPPDHGVDQTRRHSRVILDCRPLNEDHGDEPTEGTEEE